VFKFVYDFFVYSGLVGAINAYEYSYYPISTGNYPWVKRSGREADHSSQSGAEVKIVELYLHSPYAFVSWCLIKRRDVTLFNLIFIFQCPGRHCDVECFSSLIQRRFSTAYIVISN
jgi:hypothetical protein